MIFQIKYQTDNYNEYYDRNKKYTDKLDYKLFDDNEIEYFLKHYNYYETFNSLIVDSSNMIFKNAIMCDALRLMILYELGGVYIDSDVITHPDILTLENDLTIFKGNILTDTLSLYFIKGSQKSDLIFSLLQKYTTGKPLLLDVKMIKMRDIFKFRDFSIVSNNFTQKYITHHKITTTEKNMSLKSTSNN